MTRLVARPRCRCSTRHSTTSPIPTWPAAGSTPPTTPSRLLMRPADPIDGATPVGGIAGRRSSAARSTFGPPSSADRYGAAARRRWPRATPILAQGAALRRPLAGGRRGGRSGAAPDRGGMRVRGIRSCWRPHGPLAPGGAIVVGGAVDSSELLAGRDRIGGRDAAYVCRGRTCDLPVTTAPELAAALGRSV